MCLKLIILKIKVSVIIIFQTISCDVLKVSFDIQVRSSFIIHLHYYFLPGGVFYFNRLKLNLLNNTKVKH